MRAASWQRYCRGVDAKTRRRTDWPIRESGRRECERDHWRGRGDAWAGHWVPMGSGSRTGRFGGSLSQDETTRCVAGGSAASLRRNPIRPTREKESWLAKRLAGNEGCDPDGSRRGCYGAANWLTRSTMRMGRCGTARSRDRSGQSARGCAALARPAQPATTHCAVCATPAICRIAASNCSTGWPPWIRWRSLMITDGTALMPWLW